MINSHQFLSLCCIVFICSIAPLSAQETSVVQLRGLKTVAMNSSATAVAMKEVDGLLVLANLVQVEIHLDNRIIAQHDYKDLLGIEGIGRYDELYIEVDTANAHIYIIHPLYGIGRICYACHVSKNSTLGKRLIEAGNWETKDPLLKKQPFWSNLVKEGTEKGRKDFLRSWNKSVWIDPDVDRHIYLQQNDEFCYIDVEIPLRAITEDLYLSKKNGLKVFIAATKDRGLIEIQIDSVGFLKQVKNLNYKLPNGFELKHMRSVHYMENYKGVLLGSLGEGVFLWSHLSDEVFTPFRTSEVDTTMLRFDNKRNHIWTTCKVVNNGFLTGNDIGTIDYLDNTNGIQLQRPVFQASDRPQVIQMVSDPNSNQFYAGLRNENGDNKIYRLAWNDTLRRNRLGLKDSLNFKKEEGKLHVLFHLNDKLWVGTDNGLYFTNKLDTLQLRLKTGGAVRFIVPDSIQQGEGFFFGGEADTIYFLSSNGVLPYTTPDRIKNISSIIPLKKNKYVVTTRGDGFYLCSLSSKNQGFELLPHFDPEDELVAYTKDGGAAGQPAQPTQAAAVIDTFFFDLSIHSNCILY